MSERLVREYRLLAHQVAYLQSESPACAMIAGVGSGKTHVGALGAYLASLSRPAGTVACGSPTFAMIQSGPVDTYQRASEEWGFEFEYKRSRKLIEFYTPTESGRTITTAIKALSFEDPDKNRGHNLSYIWLDEPAIMPELALTVALARLRVTDNPQLRMTGTPAGFNWVQEFLVGDLDAAATADPALYARLAAQRQIIDGIPTQANHFNPPSFLESLNTSYDPQTYEQEVKGLFVNLGQGRVYHQFDRAVHCRSFDWPRQEHPELDPNRPVLYSCDFNILGSAVLAQWWKDELWVFDEIQVPESKTWEVCLEAVRRYPQVKSWVVTGDGTGTHGDTRSRYNDWEIVRQVFRERKWEGRALGEWNFREETWERNPAVKDTVTLANAKLHFGKIRVHPRCRLLIRDLEQVVYKKGSSDINKGNDSLTHLSDAFRYAVKAAYYHRADQPSIRM